MRTQGIPLAFRFHAVATFAAMLAACGGGGGGGGGAAARSGTFVDDPVAGVHFVSGAFSGETDAAGTFSYAFNGDFITFTVGDIEIGTGHVRPIMTPLDLVRDGDPTAVDETNEHTANIGRFLQTVDDDGDPANGILITQAVHDMAVGLSIEFAQAVAAFESDADVQGAIASLTAATTAGARPLVPLDGARDRLHDALLLSWVGCYTGSFDVWRNEQHFGGTYWFHVRPDGAVSGIWDTSFLTGEVASSGDFVLHVPYRTLTVTGTIVTGVADGEWLHHPRQCA